MPTVGVQNVDVPLRLDHPRFESMTKALRHILGEYVARDGPQPCEQGCPGVLRPQEVPGFLFRGECGLFAATTASLARARDNLSIGDVRKLAEVSDWIAAGLHEEREGLSWHYAFALLQHYGMPSRIVDFTGDVGLALAFAGHGKYDVGRLAVLPYVPSPSGPIVELFAHPWAERAQRQAAYGVVMDPHDIYDLKSDAAQNRLKIRWYEFRIQPAEKELCELRVHELLRQTDDPSAGFLRYYITRYVEAFQKLSPTLTEWLLEHVVIAPYCCMVAAHEGKETVVYFRGSEYLPKFDRDVEIGWSRRYWSAAYDDDSRRRVEGLVMPPPGQYFVDPRTYHPETGSATASQRST
jgi:hypothetical protein